MDVLKNKKALIFPMLVICLSAVSLVDNFSPLDYFSIITSVIGAIGAVQFLKDGECNTHMLEIWLFAQIPHISNTIFVTSSTPYYVDKIVDASQVFVIKAGMHLSSQTEQTYIGINILPLLVIGVLRYLKLPYQKMTNSRKFSAA